MRNMGCYNNLHTIYQYYEDFQLCSKLAVVLLMSLNKPQDSNKMSLSSIND